MRKSLYIFCAAIVLLYLCATIHYYDINRATSYLTEHAARKSQSLCAQYVREAIEAGGICLRFTYMHPRSADGYDVFLPKLGFKEIEQYDKKHPQKGDVIVIKARGSHKDGHIAMYNGKQWISDFKQRDMYGSGEYRQKGTEYHFYRKKSGFGMRKIF